MCSTKGGKGNPPKLKNEMRIGFVQTSPLFGEKQKNFAAALDLLNGCKAGLLVFPELFATGYTFTSASEVKDLSEATGEETTKFIKLVCALTGATVVAGFIEREKGKYFNSAMMAGSDGLIVTYRKIHLFNREKLWFSPGDKAPAVYKTGHLKIGMMICFDWIFPETCRSLALKGAQVIAHPCNLVLPWAQQAMTTRCIENRVFAVTANRIGREMRGMDDFRFTGQSQVTGCRGEILASAPDDEACVRFVDIDPAMALDKSVNPFNDLFGDRREELYGQ
jgi:predicted amidohydrolase